MQANDLNIARERLIQKNLALVVVKKDEVVFETSSHGIGGLLKTIEELGKEMKGSSVGDKVVGKAAALLCIHAGVLGVFAIIASEKAVQELRKNNVLCRFKNRVPHILNSQRSRICPFEKLVVSTSNPKKAYEQLKSFATERKLI